MECVPITTISRNGQLVIPESVRSTLNILAGMRFAVFAGKDSIILKRVAVPTAEEAFDELHKWGVAYAKAKGLKEKDVVKKIHDGRKQKG